MVEVNKKPKKISGARIEARMGNWGCTPVDVARPISGGC